MSRSIVMRRIALSLLGGLIFGVVFSEGTFYFLNNGQTRPPKVVELVIPPGTAAKVAKGESDPSLPANMLFVVGDTLLVTNRDSAAHQLGPLFIPPGASASMRLSSEDSYNFICSFEPTKYLGLSVLPPLTIATRVVGILEAGLPVGMLIAVYAAFATPLKKQAPA